MTNNDIREVITEMDSAWRTVRMLIGDEAWAKKFSHLIIMQLLQVAPESRRKCLHYIAMFMNDIKDEAFEDGEDAISFMLELVEEKRKQQDGK